MNPFEAAYTCFLLPRPHTGHWFFFFHHRLITAFHRNVCLSWFFPIWSWAQQEKLLLADWCWLSGCVSERPAWYSWGLLHSLLNWLWRSSADKEKSIFYFLLFFPCVCLGAFTSRWWAWMLIKGLSPEETLQVRAKVASLEALKGQRADLGLQRAWEGNYLVRVGEV